VDPNHLARWCAGGRDGLALPTYSTPFMNGQTEKCHRASSINLSISHLANHVDALFPSFRIAQERYRPPTRRRKHWKKFCSVPPPQLADKTPRLTFRNIWPDI